MLCKRMVSIGFKSQHFEARHHRRAEDSALQVWDPHMGILGDHNYDVVNLG